MPVLAALLTLCGGRGVSAADGDWWGALGARFGTVVNANDEDFKQYGVTGLIGLPFQWGDPVSAVYLKPAVSLHGGVLRAENGDWSGIGALGLDLVLESPRSPLALVGSVQAAFLAEHELGGMDLGGAFNIVGEIGVDIRPTRFFSMGYRFHHMSNAGIYDNNPGLNLHMVELAWRF